MALTPKKISTYPPLLKGSIDTTTNIVVLSGSTPQNKNLPVGDFIEDSLDSTSAVRPLSAKQGKVLKESIALKGNAIDLNLHVNNKLNPHEVTKSQIGLGNVTNTSDSDKPISTAQQAALNQKANLSGATFTGPVNGITKSMVGLGNVANESKATMFTNPTFTGIAIAPTPTNPNSTQIATTKFVSDKDDYLQSQLSAAIGGLRGGIAPTATAPKPGASGYYDFIASGECAWITSGAVTVNALDRVYVNYTELPTPSYEYIYVPSELVHTTGNETIGGIKTFSSSPIVPDPTSWDHAVNATYVEDGLDGKLNFVSTNEQSVLDALTDLRCTTVLCNTSGGDFSGSTLSTFSGYFTVYCSIDGGYATQKAFSALKKAWYYRKLDTTWTDWELDTSIESNYWVKKGLILPSFDNSDSDIKLTGIIDIKVLYDRDSYLENNNVYLWAYGNKKNELNQPERYIYFTKENYVDSDSILCYSGIKGTIGAANSSIIENFIVEEQNDSGLSFIVTINWGEIDEVAIDNSDLVKINPYINVGVVDKIKDSFFINDSSNFKKLPDGFILDISMNRATTESGLAIWYISNTESSRSLYIGKKASNNIILPVDNSIYSTYTAVGSSSEIEDVILTPIETDASTFYMKVDWSKIPIGYDSISSGNLSCTLNTKNIPFSKEFDIFQNMPILPSQLFFRSDKSIPIFKNSIFTKLADTEKVDVGLICSDSSGSKVVDIKEPSNIGGVNGDSIISGNGKFILNKTSDYSKFIHKDISVFIKDVSTIPAQTVKIMSIGDSLTEGVLWSNTPVCMLADELSAIGITTQFIGSLARTYINKQSQSVKINYEGRGGWRYRTLTGLESMYAGYNVIIPAGSTKSEWVEGVDGSFDEIKRNNPFLYPATSLDKVNYPDFCFNFISGNTGYNQSYTDNPGLVDYVIFDPARYFSERNIAIPDVITIAFGTNEWYLPSFDLANASKHFKFIVQQFRRASASVKIVIIPANALNLRRQSEWETMASVLTSKIIKSANELLDSKLYVCPVYINSSRALAWDNLTSTPEYISDNNDVKSATISQDVHSLYVDDESNNQYADSLAACVLNII